MSCSSPRCFGCCRRAASSRALSALLVTTILLLAGPLSGCASAASSERMTVPATAIARVEVPPALHHRVTIGPVTGGHDTNPLWMSKVGNEEFALALRDSLAAAGLLAEGPDAGQYVLAAHLSRLKQPAFGFDLKVTATVDYELRDRSHGTPVYQTQVATPYTADMGDAFLGVERLRLANEGAIRSNIQRLIEELVENFASFPPP
jgi:hypothetical protein